MIDAACIALAWSFLGQMHLQPKVRPEIIVTGEIKHSGFQSGHKVFLKPEANCGVLVHETVHVYQEEIAGVAPRVGLEWFMREQAAFNVQQIFDAMEKD